MTLNELLVEFYRWRSDDPADVNAADEIEMAVKVLEDAYAKGLVDKYELKSVRDTPFRITAAGEIALPEWDIGYTPAEDFEELVDSSELEESRSGPLTIDSAAWTGLTSTTINARNAVVVGGLIDKALASISTSTAGNFEAMQAAAYLKAAKELVEAPEPPSRMIWDLISKAADVVGLIGLFFTIFAQVNA